MAVEHHGRFSTIYVCPRCAAHVTIPGPLDRIVVARERDE
jgi:hypothetical protein